MNGNKILLDTNAFIYFFEGRSTITDLVVNTPEIYFSAISEIELLSATHLTPNEIDSIKAFLLLCQRVELTTDIIDQTIMIRRQYRFKVPDAIIAASALHLKIPLVSADTDFQKVTGLTLISNILT
ncbi:MAG TPA: type II toxin-antitoxin system VapC family toxin [Cyclobacteriaceae bacterium]|nr:type II toxin-antitoxin system VapC family toxin [Cyclobacteriaceae bacterium]